MNKRYEERAWWRALPLNSSWHRELGFRRALKHAGYQPRSIDLAVEKHRDWIRGEGR